MNEPALPLSAQLAVSDFELFGLPVQFAHDRAQLDFVREGLNEGFKFHNPREKDRCGCGESFRV